MNKSITPNCDVPSLWLEHKKELRNFIYSRVKDKDLADELLQEVLMKVYSFCLSKSGISNVRSWLFQIARNTIIDNYRKQAKFTDQPENLPEVVEEDENTAFKEAVNFIEPILQFLPEEYAVPLRMADIEGMKQADIAEKLNLTLPAAKSRIQRARQLLKAEFITCCHLETDATGNLISFAVKDSCKPLQQIKNKISD